MLSCGTLFASQPHLTGPITKALMANVPDMRHEKTDVLAPSSVRRQLSRWTFETALITGSSRGLGRQLAVKLASEGVKKLAIHYRTGFAEAQKTMRLVEDAGASAVLVQGDVADVAAAEALVHDAAQRLGGCDIFVQSVCPPLSEIYEHVMSTELSLSKWQTAFDTQARAFFICARTAAKYMQHGGRIIGLSYSHSGRTGGWQPGVGMGPAKAAMDSIVGYFAVALGQRGITVNTVSPGMSDGGVMEQRHRSSGPMTQWDRIRVDADATAGHTAGYRRCVCVALQ